MAAVAEAGRLHAVDRRGVAALRRGIVGRDGVGMICRTGVRRVRRVRMTGVAATGLAAPCGVVAVSGVVVLVGIGRHPAGTIAVRPLHVPVQASDGRRRARPLEGQQRDEDDQQDPAHGSRL